MNKELDEAYRIFEEVFKKDNKEMFDNKHYSNPYHLEEPFSFYEVDGKKVGMNAFMGMMYKGKDCQITLAQSCDTAVLKEFRGKGLFTKIVNKRENEDRETQFIWGIPNGNSYNGFLKMGWIEKTKLYNCNYYTAPFSYYLGNNVISKILDWLPKKGSFLIKRKLTSAEAISKKDILQLSNEDFNRVNDEIHNGFIRTREYFVWKLKYKNHKCVELMENNLLKGYLIYRIEQAKKGSCITIDDYWACGDFVQKATTYGKLVGSIQDRANVIKVPCVNVNSEDYRIWRKLHFLIMKKRALPFLVSPRGKDNIDIANIKFRFIDFDVYNNM